MRTIPMPGEGLYRAGRWGDVERFPALPTPIEGLALGQPQLDGPRWDDASGGFATAKCSRTSEAAIGRVFARYRARVVPPNDTETADDDLHGGIINVIKGWLTHEPDYEHEPELVSGIVPSEIFPRLCEIHLPASLGLEFIDIADEDVQREIVGFAGDLFERLGLPSLVGNNLARERDRRLSRLVLSVLHELHGANAAGIRVPGQPDDAWESFVIWDSAGVDFAVDADAFRWVAPWDEDAVNAAKCLDVRLPED
jgi:hypothetical protein